MVLIIIIDDKIKNDINLLLNNMKYYTNLTNLYILCKKNI